MFFKAFIKRIKRKLLHLRLQPIHVYCFHQVSDSFDSRGMWQCDWTQTELFKRSILAIKSRAHFISLEEAYSHIVNDRVRLNKFAVLTADDGWESLTNIIPWLAEQGIPITLFINPLYLDGVHKQMREAEKILTFENIQHLVTKFSPLISIASHGWSHRDCLLMTDEEFVENVDKADSVLRKIDGYIPFYAFTFGRCVDTQLKYLGEKGLIPVLVDGEKNYNQRYISRECIDGGVTNVPRV